MEHMRVYLDTCCLQRPLDDQTQPRIRVETEAVFAILALVQAGVATLLSSEALEFEISRIPDEHRRREAMAILTLAGERLLLSNTSEQLAESMARAGLSAIDALHVALAATAGADYFVTADDRLLRKAKSLSNLTVTAVSILELISEISP
jgi:predicted nucleic acid-binding protein